MLQAIRDRASGLITGTIVVLISLSFALWGINSYFTGPGEAVLAESHDWEISRSEFARAYQRQLRQLQNMYGDAFRPELINEDLLKQQVLEALVTDALLNGHIAREGFAVSSSQLAQQIYEIPIFQVDGRFSSERYQQWVASQGYTTIGFEQELRQAIRREQFNGGIEATSMATGAELTTFLELQQERRDVVLVRIIGSYFEAQASISGEDVQTYFDENGDQFVTEERAQIDYVQLDPAEIAAEIELDEAMLRSRYQTEQQRFGAPERRRIRYLLLQESLGEEKAQAVFSQVDDALAQGRSFSEIVEGYLEDSDSNIEGGDLGWVVPGVLPAALDPVAFELNVGELGGPVMTEYGFHIVFVEQIDAPKTASFEDVRDELARAYRQELAQERIQDYAERLDAISFENPGSLQPVSDELALPIQRSDWIKRDFGTGIGADSAVREVVFSQELLELGVNSPMVTLDDGRLVVFRLAVHESPKPLPFERVADQVEQAVRQQRAQELMDATYDRLREALREGADPDSLSQDGVEVEALGWIGRAASDAVSPSIARAAFEIVAPKQGQTARLRVQLPDDQGIGIVIVRGVEAGDPDSVGAEAREALRAQLARSAAVAELDGYVRDLRARQDVQVYPDRL
ncbi:MAG: SurA N-terminal domain-containing protein [Pseudomonadota bacterium]|nr:SurA N-terminal domain-containing protein [Pseudomonadota bacterium]